MDLVRGVFVIKLSNGILRAFMQEAVGAYSGKERRQIHHEGEYGQESGYG
jgi:hypothetical protein